MMLKPGNATHKRNAHMQTSRKLFSLQTIRLKWEDLSTTTDGYHTANAVTQNTIGNNITKPASKPEDVHYCWSLRLMHDCMTNSNAAHNSTTCKYPAKVHVKEATWQNICGSNNFICCIPKEQEKWEWGEPRSDHNEANRARQANKPVTAAMSKTIKSPLGSSTTSHNFIIDTKCTGHFLAVSAPYKINKAQPEVLVYSYQTRQ